MRNKKLPLIGLLKGRFPFFAVVAVYVTSTVLAPFQLIGAVNISTPPTITIDSITDAVGEHLPPFDFTCGTTPLFGDVSVAGSGSASAPPGNIDQYGVEVDWGDGVTNDSTNDPSIVDFTVNLPAPLPTHGDFTYNYDAGPHTYTTGGTFEIHTRLYHVNPSGNDANADVFITVNTCVVVIPPGTGILNVTKVVDNTGGGTKTESDFTASINGGAAFALSDVAIPVTVDEGAYTTVETADPEYTTTYSADCNGTMVAQDVKDCTITNTFIQQPLGSLTITKNVVNDNGGTATADQSTFVISPAIDEDGDSTIDDGILEIPSGDDTVTFTNVPDGTYSLVEVPVDGYLLTDVSGDCVVDGQTGAISATVAAGNPATDAACTFTNDDQPAELTVIKHVVNDEGGTAVAGDFTMDVTGTNVSDDSFPGDESGTVVTLDAGSYDVTETGGGNYNGTLDADCSGTIAVGESKTCTITNDDFIPAPTMGTIIVEKTVTNDNGGTAIVSDFSLFVDATQVTSGDSTQFNPGTYVVTETGTSGYVGTFGGDCDADGNVTVAAGETKTCTLVNDDQQASLTVIKHVVNDDGGTAVASDFTLDVTGTNVSDASVQGDEAGTTVTLDAGSFSVTEDASATYDSSMSGTCSGTLTPGEQVTCTVTNDDIADDPDPDPDPTTGTITVTKIVINDDSGTSVVSDFPLFVGNIQVDSGDTNTFDPGTYTIGETNGGGYDPTYSGDCDANGDLTLAAGQDLSCTITNNDVALSQTGTIMVLKVVINDDGGTSEISDFPLFVGQTQVDSGDANSFAVGDYQISETNDPDEYDATFSGDCDANGNLTLGSGDELICTITNDDVHVVTHHGGGGGYSGGGSSDGGPDTTDTTTPPPVVTPPGQVLGTTDEAVDPVDPVDPPAGQVLDAVDELPRTGIPAYVLLLLALPILWAARRDEKTK